MNDTPENNTFLSDDHAPWMREAIREAEQARDAGETPAGCVIVDRTHRGGSPAAILGRGHNRTERDRDPTAHAEIIAIRQACATRQDWRLTQTALYVTKEPCAMCAGAIILARIPLVVFGVADPVRGGACSVFQILRHPNLNHRADVLGGVLETPCRALLVDFFKNCRRVRRVPPDHAAHAGAAPPVPPGADCPDRNG